jgi:hypothetical protein
MPVVITAPPRPGYNDFFSVVETTTLKFTDATHANLKNEVTDWGDLPQE